MPPDLAAAPSRSCALDLALDPTAPRVARSLLALLLRQWAVDDQDVADDAALVLSELVTNALLHCEGGGPITVRLELQDDRLRLEVADRSPAVPAQRVASPNAEDGRGLDIVSQIAARWGVEPRPGGKRVYAELPLTRLRCA